MALPGSGPLSMSQIAGEFGGSTPHSLNEYYGVASGIPSSGTISINQFYGKEKPNYIRYLVVAGGGPGAWGGGGAGGMIEDTVSGIAQSVSGSATVGAGKSVSDANLEGPAVRGNNSSLSISGVATITTIGGGGGGGLTESPDFNFDGFANGGSGGSGGGSSPHGNSGTGDAGTGTSGQGFNGSQARNSRGGYDGAGGGAGGAASGPTPGPGKVSNITGSDVTYAAGADGSGLNPSAKGSGSSGYNTNSQPGIIIIRIPNSKTFTSSGLTVSMTTTGSDRVYSITGGSGSWAIN
jgi:hypothetical protein